MKSTILKSIAVVTIFLTNVNAFAEQQNPTMSLYKSIKWLAIKLEANMYEMGYDARENLDYMAAIEYAKRALNAGADPNYYESPSFKAIISGFLYTDISMLGAAILISGEVGNTDLLEAFLAKGADVHFQTQNGWTAADFALMNYDAAQTASTEKLRNALKIFEILETRGSSILEANEAARIMNLPSVNGLHYQPTLENSAHELQTLRTLMDLGLLQMSRYEAAAIGRSEIRDQLQSFPSIPIQELVKAGAKLNDYSDELPTDHYFHKTDVSESLESLSARYRRVMGDLRLKDAIQSLRTRNPSLSLVNDTDILAEGTPIEIPLIETVDVTLRSPPAPTWTAMAEKLAADHVFYRRSDSAAKILVELASLNQFDPENQSDTSTEIPEGRKVLVPYTRDRYDEFKPRRAPKTYDSRRKVTLFVIESKSSRIEHDRHTFRVASNVGRAINPDVTLDSFQSWNEILILYPYSLKISEALRSILNLGGSTMQEQVVFSHSMGTDNTSARAEVYRDRRDPDNFDYNSIYSFQPYLEKGKPIIFHSAGNFNLSEGKFAPYYAIVHSPRTVMVGAAGHYQVGRPYVIAPYSSQGGDFCAPLPKRRGRWMEGTSFSTPLAAGIYRQYEEWYGNRLTPEEILAAAMWTTDTSLREFNDVYGGNAAALAGDMAKLDSLGTHPAAFRRNGGGLPVNDHCGAGLLDYEKWQEGLDWMVAAKVFPTKEFSAQVNVELNKDLSNPDENRFVYEAIVPEDLTLGKLTFFVPQFKRRHSDIAITMPSGFQMNLIRSTTDVVSTYSFAYEDVVKGSRIRLSSLRPLAPTAAIIIRGFGSESVIKKFRDQRRQTLTARSTEY